MIVSVTIDGLRIDGRWWKTSRAMNREWNEPWTGSRDVIEMAASSRLDRCAVELMNGVSLILVASMRLRWWRLRRVPVQSHGE